jgi:hypothetical protein
MADRPATADEIEITHEMIEAGAREVLEYSRRFDNEREVAERVFCVMLEKWLALRKERRTT